MEMQGELQGKVWFRCVRCHYASLIDPKELQGQSNSNGILDASKATPYDPQSIFQVGEAIFHSTWNDVGRVTSKVKTSGGGQAIDVSFQKNGLRRLIENLKPEPSSVIGANEVL